MKSLIVVIVFIVLIGGGIGLAVTLNKPNSPEPTADVQKIPAETKAVVYKTATCGCCKVYSQYLPKEGIKTETVDISSEELSAMQAKYNIPKDLASCHLTIIGDYVVSGHIPSEAIAKLLNEKPQISGIALAGMPSGTPGMPGPKTDSWVIYSVNSDGTTSEFMTI